MEANKLQEIFKNAKSSDIIQVIKKNVKYVTFHINTLGGYTPIAVKCDNFEEAQDVYFDVISLHGYSFVRMNYNGNIRKDCIVVDKTQYFDYNNHDKWVKEYYDKCFNPNNF